jgi:AcrR family transcriptional regulator
MRRIAAEISAGPMSLYSYVPDKDTLLELMIDEVSGESYPSATGDWAVDLRGFAYAQRAIMRRHPWLPSVLSTRQTLGPNVLAATEHVLGILEPVPLDGRAKLEAIALLTGFVANFVTYQAAQQQVGEGVGDDLRDAHTRYLHGVLTGGAYPRLARAIADTGPAGTGPAGGDDLDVTFDRLRDQLIHGLAPGA